MTSASTLEGELKARGLRRGYLLYSASSTFIYNGLYVDSQTQVAIKVLTNLDQQSAARCRREAENQQLLRENPHIIHLYDYFYFEQSAGIHVFVLILQYVDKDLFKEITYRSRNTYPWSAAEILNIATDLIDVLASLQKLGMAHRDIKPQNLFITSNMSIMLGDFGSSTSLHILSSEYTIVGTPFYMSPELKNLMLDFTNISGTYNPVKSDVYSLGLTLLAMYKLSPPMTLTDLTRLQESTETELSAVSDRSLQTLLSYMLQIKPENRPDFTSLDEYCKGGNPSQALHYSMTLPIEQMACEHVLQGQTVYFIYPCHGNFCKNCIPAVAFLCSDGAKVWYQITCPICFARYDMATEDTVAVPADTAQVKTEEIAEIGEARLCLYCKQPLQLSLSRTHLDDMVQLDCGHEFCSRQCFLNFYEFASHGYTHLNVVCPLCSQCIPLPFAESIYGGHLQTEVTPHPSHLCVTCRVNTGTKLVHETHWYCLGCYTFLSQPKLYRCVECPDCLSTMKTEKPRRSERNRPQEPADTGCCCFGSSRNDAQEQETDDGHVEVG